MTNQEMLTLILPYYDEKVIEMIINKYGLSAKEATRRFIKSETYNMLSNIKLEMWDFSPFGIFDMWEAEQVTGNPRNSIYIRGE